MLEWQKLGGRMRQVWPNCEGKVESFMSAELRPRNADMQSLLQERAMENARLEAELRKQTSPLQR